MIGVESSSMRTILRIRSRASKRASEAPTNSDSIITVGFPLPSLSDCGEDSDADDETSVESKVEFMKLIDRLKQEYSTHLEAINPGVTDENTYRASCFYYRAELLPLLPSDKSLRLLDVGCGFGHLLRFCLEQGYMRVVGVEIDRRIYEAACAHIGSKVELLVNADAMGFLESNPESFDVITLFDVLEHFPLEGAHQLAVLMRKALRPGGMAIFRTPNMASLFAGYSRYLDLTHQYGYTEQSLAQLLRTAGFASPRLH
ncbi:MAG: class I SAM-dependent methyltransferase, partial [Planctomycetes bacterium]|nr:class I SAM-dependent methyltransferase [Planctomycetota bacterium]